MKRNISLMLGIIVGVLAMLSFFHPKFISASFPKQFRIENLKIWKVSRDTEPTGRQSFNTQIKRKPVQLPDKCL
jgi:hypothetical protein